MSTVTLKQRYEEYANVESDIVEHLPTFVALTHELGATKIIELGVRSGVSTVAWLFALQDQGELWSVDLEPCSINFGYPDHWHFLLGDDCDAYVQAQLPVDADIVFIDTSHDYGHTVCEIEDYYPRVRPGGLMLFHDTEVAYPQGIDMMGEPYPVKRAIEEFCQAHDLRSTNDERCNGLGTIFVPLDKGENRDG